MSVVSLYQVDLAEFKNVCENWTSSLTDTLQHTSTQLQSTESTYTSATYARTPEVPVGVPSSFEAHFGPETADVDSVALLEASSSDQMIGDTYCDTYVRAADASTQLEVSQRMSDYLIDINIYQYVLKQYVLKLRSNYLNNREKMLYKRMLGIDIIRYVKCELNQYDVEDQIDILHNIENSEQLKQLSLVLNISINVGFYLFKMLLFTKYNIMYCNREHEIDYVITLNGRTSITQLKKKNLLCNICGMYHMNSIGTQAFIDMNNRYKLLTYAQCENRIKNCLNL